MKPGQWITIAAGVALLAAGTAFGIERWRYADRYVTTDNAQLDGVIIPIRARTSGTVESVNAGDNTTVQRTGLLVLLRDVDATQRVNQAQADYAALLFDAGKGGSPGSLDSRARAANATTDATQAAIQQLQANLANAQAEYERAARLAAQKMASTESLESARAKVDALAHGVEAARSNSQAAYQGALAQRAQLKAQDFRIDAARARLAMAQEQLADTRIAAPRDGVTSRKAVEPGQYVVVGQQLMSLICPDDVWVVANLKEVDIGRVRNGQVASVTLDAYPDMVLEGVVQSVGPATGAKFSLLPQENATGNFTKVVQRVPVRIGLRTLDANRRLQLQLRPGLSAVVTIRVAEAP